MSSKFPLIKAILSSFLLITLFLNFTGVVFAAPGDLDPAFDTDGKVTTEMGTSDAKANAVAVQPDGKIVAAGFAEVGGTNQFANDFALARYNTDGSLDATFDTDGKVTTAFGTSIDQVEALALQPDGKIIAGGWAVFTDASSDFALARYNTDGSLDTSFDTDGKVTTAIGASSDQIYSVALQPDGKIVVAGFSRTANDDFALARYNTNGSLDTTFDGDGKLTIDFDSGIDSGEAVAIQPDGKIVMAGYGSVGGSYFDYVLIRFNSDGSLDTSFDSDGKASIAIGESNDEAFAIALQPDGKIVAAGRSFFNGLGYHYTLARFNPNGSLDSTFDTDGRVMTNFDVGGFDTAFALALQTDGKILAVGSVGVGSQFYDVALARYNPNGSLDTTFDTDGKLTMSYGGTDEEAYAVALQPNGKIVVAGYTLISNKWLFALARYTGDPVASRSKPFDFDGDGKTDISIFRPSVGEWWYLRSSDAQNRAFQFGSSSDKLTPADFTGDGKTDVAFWRPATGEWFVLRSENASYYSFPFGTSGDIPLVGDFDSDGKADAAIFRPSTSTWYISRSAGGTTIQQFGISSDVPVVADYDGDGRADIAIYRPSVGEWWIQRSTAGLIAFQFGNSSDKPVQGDYTGDGKADVAFFRPSSGEWFVLRSENQSYYSFPFGISTDVPAPGDYDGDAKFDATVFRPSGSTWYVNKSGGGQLIQNFGMAGDLPVPNAFGVQ
jgi:uncharacterized delta-60 repeat protein